MPEYIQRYRALLALLRQPHLLTDDVCSTKCDEARPRCTACTRHNVPCVYSQPPSSNNLDPQERQTPPINGPYYDQPESQGSVPVEAFDHMLELRLMHEWTAYACKTFSTTWEFWYYQAPLLALEYRYLLDAMLAIAALHASKQPPAQWNPIEGRVMVTKDQIYTPGRSEAGGTTPAYWKQLSKEGVMDSVVNALNNSQSTAFMGTKRSRGMVTVSRTYFDRAIDGYRHALQNITIENVEAIFTTSILVSFHALFALCEGAHDSILPPLEPSFWLRLGRGNYWVIQRFRELEGDAWMARSGVMYGEPDLSDDDYIFAPEHAKPFEKLLTFAADLEVITDEDRYAYERTLSYIGVTYKAIAEDNESPLATNRRLTAMPSKCPARFVDLVEAKQPRAMVMLAHIFASMKLAAHDSIWFKGIAELQVPIIYEQLPVGWRELMEWPMAIALGDVDEISRDRLVKETRGESSLRA